MIRRASNSGRPIAESAARGDAPKFLLFRPFLKGQPASGQPQQGAVSRRRRADRRGYTLHLVQNPPIVVIYATGLGCANRRRRSGKWAQWDL